jgi:hypothetical protein
MEQGFDYIFGRMSAIYGNDFARKWDGIDPNLIRQEWIGTMGRFLTYRPIMDYALRHIDPQRPPSSLQFRKICQDGPNFPQPEQPKRIETSVPEVNEEVKRQALEKFAKLRKEFASYPRHI